MAGTTIKPEETPFQRNMRPLSWAALRTLGNSLSVRVSALFPLVGFWILFNNQAREFLNLGQLEDHLSIGWIDALWAKKTFLTYFGLLFLGIGSFMYQSWCPYLVKKHGDWAGYVTVDGPAMDETALAALGSVVRIPRNPLNHRTLSDYRALVMQRWYNEQSTSKPNLRLLVAFFFCTGLLILAVPSIISAIKIAELLLR